MYNDTAYDPKLRRIAYCAGTTTPNVIAVWTAMLCHAAANEGELRGTMIGWKDDDCAFHLGIDRAIVFSIRSEMEGRLLDGDKVISWTKRQFQSDTSRERTQDYRERRKGTSQSGDEQKQRPNPDVTSRDRHATAVRRHGDAPDTDTETDTETERGASPPTRTHTRTREEDPPALPDWLSPEAWAEWSTYRTAKCRKTWTQLAAKKSIQTLSKLRDEGHDPVEVIDQAIASGWTGLFPVKGGTAIAKANSRSWIYDNDDPLWRQPQ